MFGFGKRRETPAATKFVPCDGCPEPEITETVGGVTYTYRYSHTQTDNTRGRGNDRGYFKDYRQGIRVAVYDLVG